MPTTTTRTPAASQPLFVFGAEPRCDGGGETLSDLAGLGVSSDMAFLSVRVPGPQTAASYRFSHVVGTLDQIDLIWRMCRHNQVLPEPSSAGLI